MQLSALITKLELPRTMRHFSFRLFSNANDVPRIQKHSMQHKIQYPIDGPTNTNKKMTASDDDGNATTAATIGGGQLEERIDLSAETAEKIAQAKSLPPSSLADALAILSALEKRCRVGNDTPSLVRVCESSLELCYDAHDFEALIATLKNLCTRRSQKSKAIGALVAKCLPWCVDAAGDGYTPLPITSIMP